MTRGYFNWKLAIVLLLGAIVLAVTALGLRRWQRNTRADQALPVGQAAYDDQKWEEAASQLGRYLAVNQDNVPILLKYADAQLHIRPLTTDNVQQAVAAYRSVLRLDKSNLEAASRLVDLYLGTSSPGEAELIAKRYLRDNDEDLALRRLLAMALVRQRKFGEAKTELMDIIKGHPDDVFAYQAMGQLAAQRPEEVNEPPAFWYDEAVSKNPDSALAYAVRASFHLARNERREALADLERAQECDLSDTDVHLNLVGGLINAGQIEQAREHLEALKTQAPTEPRVWQGWADLALRSGSPEEMHQVAAAGLDALASQPWDFMPTAIELFIRSDHLDEAEDRLAQMRQQNMLPAIAFFLEGLLAEKQERFRDAIVAWQRGIVLGYKPPRSRMFLASAFSRLGDYQSAIGQFRIVVSENPGYLEGHLALAHLLARIRDWPGVLDAARRVLSISPSHAGGALMEVQARIHLLAGDEALAPGVGKAWEEIEARLLQLDAANPGARQVMLLRARAALVQGKHAETENVLDEIERTHPSDPDAALLRAELYLAQGSDQAAVSLLRTTVEEQPQNFDAVRSLMLLLNRQDQRDACESVAQEAFARMEKPQARREVGLSLDTLYLKWKQHDDRYRWLTSLSQQFPDDIQIKRRLLTCDPVTKDAKRAQEMIDEIKLLEGDGGWQWRYEQARLWMASDSFDDLYGQMVALLQENLLANPQDLFSRLLLGAAHMKAGELQRAIAVYREALNRSPDNAQVMVRAVDALQKAGERDEAQEILDRAEDRGIDHPDLQRLRLRDRFLEEEWAPASNILRELVREDPNDSSFSFYLVLTLMGEEKFDEAQTLLDELKAKTPGSLAMVVTQVRLHIKQGHAEEAIRLCDETVANLGNAFAYMLRAGVYGALEQNDKALEDFNRAIEMAPDNADVWMARGYFYLRPLGRIRDAVEDAKEALELAPDSLSVQRRAIFILLASGDSSLVRQADELLDKALASEPADIQLRLFKARVLLFQGTAVSAQRARQLLQEITSEKPRLAEAWELSGRLELQQGQPGRAVDVVSRGMTHCDEDTAGYRGLLLFKAEAEARRLPKLAVPTLKAWVDSHPDDTDAIVQLADVYIRADQSQQAIELMRRHLADVTDPTARRRCEATLAVALYKNGETEKADVLVEALTQVAPDDVATPVMIAGALAMGRDPAALRTAEEILRATLERHPKSLPALSLLAMVVQSTGRQDESVALNRRILELNPNNVVAINNLAWILCEEQGQHQQALELAERGMKLAPEYADLLDTRGVAHYRLGHFAEAVDDFRRCLNLFPAGSPSSTVSRFHLARAYAEMGRKTQAAQQLKEALDRHDRIGGLSPENLGDAKLLLEQLQKGS